MRIIRAVIGTLLLLIALPMLIAGGVLWESSRHRDPDGAFRAAVEPLHADGAAIVVWDLDGLLRREAAFARGGRTTVEIDVPGQFVGVGPRADVQRYLAGTGWLEIDRVRLARGPLPVDANAIDGGTPTAEAPRATDAAITDDARTDDGLSVDGPTDDGLSVDDPVAAGGPRPDQQPFWLISANADEHKPLTFQPASIRGRDLSLVIMNGDGTSSVGADVTVAVVPRWLNQTTWGVVILGTVLLLLAVVAIAWPRPRREVVYVVEPSQVPDLVARLGLPAPTTIPNPAATPAPADEVTLTGDDHAAPAIPQPPVSVHLEWPPPPSTPRTAAPVPAAGQ